MLNFIIGPSGSGKSHTMLAALRARAARGSAASLSCRSSLPPPPRGSSTARWGQPFRLCRKLPFTSLAEALLRRYGGAAVPTLTEAGRALLRAGAADSLLDKIVYYSRQRRSAAFCEKAAQTISELKSAGVTPEMLAEYAKAPQGRPRKSWMNWP